MQDGKQVYKGKSKSNGGCQPKTSGKSGRGGGQDEEEEDVDPGKLEMGVWVVEIDQPMDLKKLR